MGREMMTQEEKRSRDKEKCDFVSNRQTKRQVQSQTIVKGEVVKMEAFPRGTAPGVDIPREKGPNGLRNTEKGKEKTRGRGTLWECITGSM